MKTPNEWWQEFRYRNDHPTDIIKAIQTEASDEAKVKCDEANALLDEVYRTFSPVNPRSHLLNRIRIFRGG